MIASLVFVFARLAIRLIQALPLGAVLRLGRWLGAAGWWLDFAHRRTAIWNVQMALSDALPGRAGSPSPPYGMGEDEGRRGRRPRPTKSEESTNDIFQPNLDEIARESFLRLVENTLAAAWMASRSDEELGSLIEVKGVEENLLPAAAMGKGVVHVMFHMGNWEALARIVSRIPSLKFSTIYQPLKNRHADRMVSAWRRKGGVGLINRHEGFQEAVRRLRKAEAVGVLVDQHAGDHGMWVPLFGRLASTTPLAAILARRTGATIIPIFCGPARSGGARWRVEFAAPIATTGLGDGEIMAEVHARLEAAISEDPANWFWVHSRWKTPSPNFLTRSYRRGVHVPPGMKLKPFRILLRTPNWLGDAVMSLPAIRAIKEGRPDCHLTLLTPPKLADLWKGQRFVDEVLTSMEGALGKSYDAAILFPNSIRSALEAWSLGIPRRQGYAGHSRKWLLTAVCPESFRSGLHEHEVKDFTGLARWSGADIAGEIPKLELPQSAAAGKPYVVLHPGAAHGTAKRWIPERFVELVRHSPDLQWRLIGSDEERERNRLLVAQMGPHVEDWTGRLDLRELAMMLQGARAVVCNDSGPMHLAAAVEAPIIAIFGSSEPQHTGPLGTGHKVLRKIVECGPCYLKECPIDLRCMKGVTVDEVKEALEDTLEENALKRGHSRSI